MATPAFRALKAANPQDDIAVICEPQTVRVFAGNPHIDRIVAISASSSFFKLTSSVRALRPSRTLDFLSNPRTAVTSFVSGAKESVGIGYGLRRLLYDRVVAVQDPKRPYYSAVHKLQLAVESTLTDSRIEFFLTPENRAFAAGYWQREALEGKRIAAFFVNSRRVYKRWPIERYADVINIAHDEFRLIPLVLQTPGDEEQVSRLRKLLGSSAAHFVAVSDLGNLAALLERCALLIGNDGGPKHLAVAMGTPTVTLFGTEPWEYWTPPNDPRHCVVTSAQIGVAESTLEAVSVAQVAEQLRELLNRV